MANREYELEYKDMRAVVSSLGASLRGFFYQDQEVVWSYRGDENKKGGQGDVLIPFPNRISQGRYEFEGVSQTMELNDKDGPNAIHGFLRKVTWRPFLIEKHRAVFRTEIRSEEFVSRGYPFSLDIELTYDLSPNGLTTAFAISNVGTTNAPVGVGFHPYFLFENETLNDWCLQLPADAIQEVQNLIPTGRKIATTSTALDFRTPKPLGDFKYNSCVYGLERNIKGEAEITLSSAKQKRVIKIYLDQAFDYVVLYSGDAIDGPDRRKAMAIEPMTCAVDAFNHPELGLKILSPRETFKGQYRILPSAEF